MKSNNSFFYKRVVFLFTIYSFSFCLVNAKAYAAESGNISSQFESLGSTEDLVNKSKALDADNKVRVVQKRKVNRNLRLELAGHYGMLNGGDSYLSTQNTGVQAEFHLTPRWSLGVRYDKYYSKLTLEGDKAFSEALAAQSIGNNYKVPDIDFPLNSQLLTVSWYPIYGKLNLFDLAISQFDIYFVAGGGKMMLETGSTNLSTVGGGLAFWFTQNFATRFELRYQGYQDTVYSGNRNINTFILNVSAGLLL
jgi:outer membrane beta-barrel protein